MAAGGGFALLFGLLIIWVEDTVETKRETEQGPQPGHVLRDESRGVPPLMDLEHGDCWQMGSKGAGASSLIINLLYVTCFLLCKHLADALAQEQSPFFYKHDTKSHMCTL